jgi:hypothetical protein
MASAMIGAARENKDDAIDPDGRDPRGCRPEGGCLWRALPLYYTGEDRVEEAAQLVEDAFRISANTPEERALIQKWSDNQAAKEWSWFTGLGLVSSSRWRSCFRTAAPSSRASSTGAGVAVRLRFPVQNALAEWFKKLSNGVNSMLATPSKANLSSATNGRSNDQFAPSSHSGPADRYLYRILFGILYYWASCKCSCAAWQP